MPALNDTSHLHIEFFVHPVENTGKSRVAGRPIFEDKEMVRIKFVGDPKKELVAPADDKFMRDRETNQALTYAQAYYRHYEAFKTGEAARGEGTPLSELTFLTEAKRAELRALNIHTAENLASLEGEALGRLGPYGRDLKNQAQTYIDKAKDNALELRLSAENASLKERLAALEEMMKASQLGAGSLNVRQHTTDPVPAPQMAPSAFDEWPDVEIKAFIKERTGETPRGNPSHATLVRMADEVMEKAE